MTTDPLSALTVFGVPVLSFIAAGAGAYLGSYLKKKGENLATKEDFNELKEQTRQLTQTTKETEAKIADRIWNKQRQWEMKRDVISDIMKRVGVLNKALNELYITCGPHSQANDEERTNCYDRWFKERLDLDEERSSAKILCGMRFTAALSSYLLQMIFVAEAARNSDQLTYFEKNDVLKADFWKLSAAARGELEFEIEDVTLQSVGSSAAPAPGSQTPE